VPEVRERHVQLELPKLDKNGQRRGGKRRGAGRPKQGFRASEKHKVRAPHRATEPVHVVMRACRDVGSLRRHAVFLAIREATLVVAASEERFPNFRIVHLSIQRTHIHLIVEAANRKQLSRGMQAFSISAARQINASTGRLHGRVFADRYHARALGSPRQVRDCIAYVLNNWRHHGADRAQLEEPWKVDPYSSSLSFDGWTQRAYIGCYYRASDGYPPPFVWLPKTWLLSEGWRRYGLVDQHEVPGRGDE
jgi:putative transposase